jgi:uncharacterized membrane protein
MSLFSNRRLGERSDLSVPRGASPRIGARYDADAFGRFSEAIARFLGTGRFLAGQTVLVVGWIVLNTVGYVNHWDPYPFILLNLAFSTQAAYAAPLILLAQNRQDDRDRANIERDREVAARTQADTEFLARELAAVRIALADVVTTQDLEESLSRLAKLITDREPSALAPPDGQSALGSSRSRLPSVEVTEQGDLGAVVQHLAVDVQEESRHRRLRVGLRGSAGPRQPGRAQPVHTVDPRGITRVELGQRRRRVARVLVRAVVEGRPAEVRGDPHAEHADHDVPDPPGDRGHRRRVRFRYGEIDGERAGTRRDRRGACAAGPDVPGSGDRLPAVLLVGQPVQPGAEVPAPVPVELIGQLLVPVDVHGLTLGTIADRISPR